MKENIWESKHWSHGWAETEKFKALERIYYPNDLTPGNYHIDEEEVNKYKNMKLLFKDCFI